MILWAGASSWSKRVERCRGKAERSSCEGGVGYLFSFFAVVLGDVGSLLHHSACHRFRFLWWEGMVQEPRVGIVLLEKLKYIKMTSTLQAFMAISLLVALVVSRDSVLGSRNGLPWSFDISLRKFQLLQIVIFPMGKWLIGQLHTSFMLELS